MIEVTAGKSVLVVEDERIIARELQQSLRTLGYAVPAIADTADAAIAAASASLPDVVLMDIHIHGALDGIQTAEILRKRFDVPVVYLTAYADPQTVARAKTTEPFGYLVKPVSDAALRSAVEVALYKHATERAVRRRERWFSTTLRSIGDGVISTDENGGVSFMNPVAESLTGWRTDTAAGRPLSEVLVLGRDTAIHDRQAPIVDDRGEILGSVIVLRDMSEQRKLHRQLELADRLASLGTLAAGVAHEINNPMAVVLANLEFALSELRRSAGLDAERAREVEGALAEALTGGRRVTRIVSDLHSFARPAKNKSDVADVRPVLEWAMQIAAHQISSRARLERDLRPVPAVGADEVRLGQIFLNLLVNAAEAIAPGAPGENVIAVRCEEVEEGVRVEVRDTGSGMTPEVMARAFDPFFSTKDVGKGTGLGLSICHGIVTSIGGKIEVESAPGKGSTFRVTLPRGAIELGTEPAPPAPKVRATVLVVDDEALLRTAFRRVLQRDHEVTVVDSGEAALEVLRAGERFDVVLSDLMMSGVSGIDLHREVMALDPDQCRRMVFVTGGAYTSAAAAFLQSIPNPFLEKPFDPATLHEHVARILAELGPAGVRRSD